MEEEKKDSHSMKITIKNAATYIVDENGKEVEQANSTNEKNESHE